MLDTLGSIGWPVLDRVHIGSKFAISPHGVGIAIGFLAGSWWVLRLPYPAGLVYDPAHVHRLLPVVVAGSVGVECTLCGWETYRLL